MTQPLQHPTVSARELGWPTRDDVIAGLRAELATATAAIAELKAQLEQTRTRQDGS